MEYQNMKNLIHNTPNQPTKFRRKKWVEINDDVRGTYNLNIQIKFKTSMLQWRLCDYIDGYIHVKGVISIVAQVGDNTNNGDKEVVFKNCPPFTNCISEISNTQIGNAKDLDVVNVVMLIYNLIKYSDITEKNQLWLMLVLLLILVPLVTVLCFLIT